MTGFRGLTRAEAQPTDWESLNSSQKKAVTQILEIIADTVDQLPDQDTDDIQHHPYLSSHRSSRIAFLDGQRGTGKSTVLITLLNFLSSNNFDNSSNMGANALKVKDTIGYLKNRVVLLEPIDMEPVPQHWNMLPAILARIEEAFSRYIPTDGKSAGLLAPSNYYHEALRKLKQLQNNVAISWDGNLNKRAAHLDPDTYAQETLRNERARIKLNPDFGRTLDALAKQINQCSQIENPIFILPIDDFDLNPRACLEMLRILRMISVPRLFALVLGDLEVVDVMINLKQSADLSAIYPNTNQGMLSVIPDEVAMLAGRISSHALHKLLPTMQCIELRALARHETLNYQPLSHRNEQHFYEILEQCTVAFGKHVKLPQSGSDLEPKPLTGFITDFYQLFLTKGYFIQNVSDKTKVEAYSEVKKVEKGSLFKRESLDNAVYSGLTLLGTPPRFAADLWIAFRKYSDFAQEQEEDSKKIFDMGVNLMAQLCRNQLLLDSALTPMGRRLTRGGFFSHSVGEWDLEALPLRTRSVIDGGTTIKINDRETNTDTSCSLLAYRGGEWRFRLEQEIESKKQSQEKPEITETYFDEKNKIEYMQRGKQYLSVDHLSTDTAGALILFHDLLSLGPNYRFNSFLLPSETSFIQDSWCKTVWQQGLGLKSKVTLRWHAPLCRSFLGLDLFLSAWNRGLEKEGSLNIEAETLAFIWISAGTAAITSQAPITIKGLNPTKNDWKNLGKNLSNIIPDKNTSPILEKQTQIWLASIALMIMPETGLPDISPMYRNQEKLCKYWNQSRRSIRAHRYLRLKKIYESNMQGLAYSLYEKPILGLDTELQERLRPHEFSDKCDRRHVSSKNNNGKRVGGEDRRSEQKKIDFKDRRYGIERRKNKMRRRSDRENVSKVA